MKSIFLPLALMFMSTSTPAATWHTLRSGTQAILEADEARVVVSKKATTEKEEEKQKKLRIWARISFVQPQQAKPGDFYYLSSRTFMEVNCTARTVKLVERVYYADDGNQIKTIHYNDQDRASAIVPDSDDEKVFDFACTPKPAKAAPPSAPSKDTPPAAAAIPAKRTPATATPKSDVPAKTPGVKTPGTTTKAAKTTK